MRIGRLLVVTLLGLGPLLAGAAWQQPKEPTGPAVGGPQAKVTNPHGPLSIPCESCHTYTSWKPIRSNPEFNHDQTGYPLRGMHEKVACTKCHADLRFKNVSTHCSDCHADIHRRQFGANCESCHTVKGWQVSIQQIRDHQNRFPLVGAHAMLQCEDCHKNAAAGQFVGLSTDCYSCHQQDFKTPVLDHVKAGFPTTCQSCHTMDTWFNAKFDHLKYTGYALTGMHSTLACTDCHINNVFAGTPASCYGCHQPDFTRTTNPNHVSAGFPTTCGTCHTTSAWSPATFDHSKVFPLTGAHATLSCAQCHTNNNFNSLPTTCIGCHQTNWAQTNNPGHAAAGFPTTCTTCHNTSNWTTVTFDHATYAKYPLTGGHASLTCVQCHTNNNYTNTSTACYSCHKANYTGTTNPNHAQLGYPTDCSMCHTTSAWTTSSFTHSAFPLTGAHATVACAQCHTNNNFTTLPTTCIGCHQTDWNNTGNPSHATAGFPTTCTTCHNTTNWTTVTFDHATYAKYPLTGAHATLTCNQCHTNNNYNNLTTDCYSCHKADFTGTTNPNHVTQGFPTNCATCHTTSAWSPSSFNHASVFPLTGVHATITCVTCHTNNNYTTLPTTCYGCHQANWNSTTDPKHSATNFPTTCDTCHSTTNWTTSTFNHNTWTTFQLTGAHTTVDCNTCHKSNNYTTLPTACYGCHQADFTGTTNPAHVTQGFPTDCTLCHTTTAWSPSSFNHSSVFPLTGAHATLTCAQCHTNNNYTTLPTSCVGCHQTDWNNTTDPKHSATNFPNTCATCHSTTNWTTSTFNHNTWTTFQLTGAHTTVDCNTCHKSDNYTTLPTTCFGCHQADYNGTTNPAHLSQGYPTDCTMCHTTTAWSPSSFNHANTSFPLTGAHTTVACAKCHVNGNFTTLPTACYGCHQSDWNGTTDPNHAAAGFPTTCDTCHTTTAWTGATFNHNNTPFPLTGAHTTVDCIKCHVNNVFAGTPTDCYSCHKADWAGTTNPNHSATGWPTTCTTCHTTTAWIPANLPSAYHTFFPVNHGNANGVCTTCHQNSSDYSIFQCTNCHSKSSTDSDHQGVSGYVYNSVNCYACHKSGGGG